MVLLHRFEQRRLRLGRRPVDLVGQDDLPEDRALHETQAAHALFFVEDFGARDVRRHQVRRELDPLEVQMEDVGEGFDQQGLRQAGNARDETMSPCEQRDEHLLDDLVLADDDLAQLGENTLAALRDPFSAGGGNRRIHGGTF